MTQPLSDREVDLRRERIARATSYPWSADPVRGLSTGPDRIIARMGVGLDMLGAQVAAFVAEGRYAVPAPLVTVGALQAERDALREMVREVAALSTTRDGANGPLQAQLSARIMMRARALLGE